MNEAYVNLSGCDRPSAVPAVFVTPTRGCCSRAQPRNFGVGPRCRGGSFLAKRNSPGGSSRSAHQSIWAAVTSRPLWRHSPLGTPRLRPTSSRLQLFVTSTTAPIASGWSGCRVKLAPTGKRRLCATHTRSGHCVSAHCTGPPLFQNGNKGQLLAALSSPRVSAAKAIWKDLIVLPNGADVMSSST
jgi:hypothetical protein